MPSLEGALDMESNHPRWAQLVRVVWSRDPALSAFCYIPVYMQRHVPNLAEEQAIYATVILVQGVV